MVKQLKMDITTTYDNVFLPVFFLDPVERVAFL